MRSTHLGIGLSIWTIATACSDLDSTSVRPSPDKDSGQTGGQSGNGSGTGGKASGGGGAGITGGGVGSGGETPATGGTDGGSGRGGAGGSIDGGNGGATGGTGGVNPSGGTAGASGGSGGSGGVGVGTGGAAPRDAGTGSSPSSGGTDGGFVDPPGSSVGLPVVLNPVCIENPGNTVNYTNALEMPSDLISALIWNGSCCALYGTQPTNQMAVLAWQYGENSWYGWQCFNAVPDIDRMAGMNLIDGMSEQYATGTDGYLWMKREYQNGRGPWEHLARPSGIRELRDIHAFRRDTFRPLLLALSEGAVFARGRKTDDPLSEFADWQTVGAVQGTRVCGGYSAGGQVLVYVLGTDGTLAAAEENATSPGTYSSFVSIASPDPDAGGPPKFTEIDCGNDTDKTVSVFAVTDHGELFRLHEGSSNWTRIEGYPDPLEAAAIAVQSATPYVDANTPYNDLTLFATTAPDGNVYTASLPMATTDGGLPVGTVKWLPLNPVH